MGPCPSASAEINITHIHTHSKSQYNTANSIRFEISLKLARKFENYYYKNGLQKFFRQHDLTMMPGSWGEDVALSTYNRVMSELQASDKNLEDRGFFMRFAFAETKYAEIILEHRGVQQIWSITHEQFSETKSFLCVEHVRLNSFLKELIFSCLSTCF